MELKTLKDMEQDDKTTTCPECGCKMCTYEETYQTKEQLRKEVIKWIKLIDSWEDGHCEPEEARRFVDGCMTDWIKHFFNIKEKDLK